MGAADALFSPFRRHARITLLGALIVLAPLVLLVHSVLRARKTLDQAAAPLKQILPGADLSVGGVSGLEVTTLALVVLSCWIFGWVIVRTEFGRSIKDWMEETFLKRTPVFQTYRKVTGTAVAEPSAPLFPAMARVAGAWQPGVIVEEWEGWATVLVPDLPSARSGRLFCVPTAHLERLDCSVADFRKTLMAGGRGSRDWLQAVSRSSVGGPSTE